MNEKNLRFPSAKSPVFAIIMLGVAVLLAVCTLFAPARALVYLLLAAALVLIMFLWIWFTAWYEFRKEYLVLRLGPFMSRIRYDAVTRATRFRGFVSSMALSGDMLELTHGEGIIAGTTYISPADMEGFLAELKSRCPNLRP